MDSDFLASSSTNPRSTPFVTPPPGETEAWNRIWARKSPLDSIVEWGRRRYNRFFWNRLSRYCSMESSFLEIGSGSGSFVLETAAHVKKSTGIDPSAVAVEHGRAVAKAENVPNAFFEVANSESLPFCDDSFDVVWSQGVLQEFADPVECLREQFRVCRPGGVVLASVAAKGGYIWYWFKATRWSLLRPFWPWTDHPFFTPAQMEEMGTAVGGAVKAHRFGFLNELVLLEIRKLIGYANRPIATAVNPP